jgi:hypothetical protein
LEVESHHALLLTLRLIVHSEQEGVERDGSGREKREGEGEGEGIEKASAKRNRKRRTTETTKIGDINHDRGYLLKW